jgi:hypothetical protein
MANIYSGMTSAQKDNERKYLNNLVSGGGGNAEWAKGQLKQLDASGGSSSTSTTSSSGSKNKGGSSYETWESGGRSYVNGIDIGPAGTKVDTSDATVNAAYSGAYSGAYGNSNKYGDMGDELKYNPYEEQYNQLKEAYKKQEEMLREQNRLAVEQGTNRLNAQKSNINQAADENARQAYVQYMQSQKALPQQLAVQGASGGATETAQLGLQTNYQNNVNSINQNKANRLQEIDNAIVDLQNTGDLSTVEQVLANNQAALDAYMNSFDKGVGYNQWANQFNANRQDTAADLAYRDKVYADNMAQQQLENEWYERNYNNSKKQEETNRVISLLENGMVDANYASTLLGIPVSQLNEFVNYINKARNLELSNTQSLINNRNSGGGNGGKGDNTGLETTVRNNIKEYYNSGKTTGEEYTDKLTVAQYLVDTDLDVAEVLKIAEENDISDIMLARAMKQAGYNNQSIEATIREYYNNNVTDNYIASVLRGI